MSIEPQTGMGSPKKDEKSVSSDKEVKKDLKKGDEDEEMKVKDKDEEGGCGTC